LPRIAAASHAFISKLRTRELGTSLFPVALVDGPVTVDFECSHIVSYAVNTGVWFVAVGRRVTAGGLAGSGLTGCVGWTGRAGWIRTDGGGCCIPGTGTMEGIPGWRGFGATGNAGLVFGGMGIGIAGVVGTGVAGTGIGWVGTGITGTGSIGTGLGAMGGPPGLSVCAGVLKTTSMLIIVANSSVRIILFFIYHIYTSVGLVVAGRRHNVLTSSIFSLTYGAGRPFDMGYNPTANFSGGNFRCRPWTSGYTP